MQVVDLRRIAASVTGAYENRVVGSLNDHAVHLSVMTEPFYWHRHPDSDEVFLVLEGGLLIEFADRQVALHEGHMLTVPAGTVHRTRPIGARSVNITVERLATTTERVPPPGAAATG